MSQLPQNRDLADMVQVDDQLQVYWVADENYHRGIVTARLSSGHHRVFFEEEGKTEDLMLKSQKWFSVGAAREPVIASQPFRSSGTSTPAPNPGLESLRLQGLDKPRDFEPPCGEKPLMVKSPGRLSGKSKKSTFANADAPRSSLRLSTRRAAGLIPVAKPSVGTSSRPVRKSKRLSLRNNVIKTTLQETLEEPKVSYNSKRVSLSNSDKVNQKRSRPVMTIQKESVPPIVLPQPRHGETRVFPNDGSDTIADVPIPRKQKILASPSSPPSSYLDDVPRTDSPSAQLEPTSPGETIPSGLQANENNNVDSRAEKQIRRVAPTPKRLEDIELDERDSRGLKRASSDLLNNGKRLKPNTPIASSSNTAENSTEPRSPGFNAATNTLKGDGHHFANITNATPSAADGWETRASTQPLSRRQVMPLDRESDGRATVVARFDAKTCHGMTCRAEKVAETPTSGTGCIHLETTVQGQLRESKKASTSLPDLPRDSASLVLHQKGQTSIVDRAEGPRESHPAFPTPVIETDVTNGRVVSGPPCTTASPSFIKSIPRDGSKREMRTRLPLDYSTKAIRELNVKSKVIPVIVDRIEKEAVEIDMTLRRHIDLVETGNREIDSLKGRVQRMQRTVASIPSSSEVKSLLESQTREINQMVQETLASVADDIRNEMKDYMSREMQDSMEAITRDIMRKGADMFKKAIDIDAARED